MSRADTEALASLGSTEVEYRRLHALEEIRYRFFLLSLFEGYLISDHFAQEIVRLNEILDREEIADNEIGNRENLIDSMSGIYPIRALISEKEKIEFSHLVDYFFVNIGQFLHLFDREKTAREVVALEESEFSNSNIFEKCNYYSIFPDLSFVISYEENKYNYFTLAVFHRHEKVATLSISEEKTNELLGLLKMTDELPGILKKKTKCIKEFFDEIKNPTATIIFGILAQYHKIELDEFIKKIPSDIRAREQRAQILTYQGDYVSALVDYNFILDRKPNSMIRRNERAAIFEKLERFNEALIDYRETMRIFKEEGHPSTALKIFHGPDVVATRGIQRVTGQLDRYEDEARLRTCLA